MPYGRGYSRLGVIAFARELFRANDLDPVYVMLNQTGLSRAERVTWSAFYWLFYDVGTATILYTRHQHLRETSMSWVELARLITPGTQARRGKERRHFRGQQALNTLTSLERWSTPLALVDYFGQPLARLVEGAWREAPGYPLGYRMVYDRITEVTGFGRWIAWKIADMLHNVLEVPVDFTESGLYVFDDPLVGARILMEVELNKRTFEEALRIAKADKGNVGGDTWGEAIAWLSKRLPGHGVDQLETVLCKWKAHLGGHYPMGNDVVELHESLHRLDPEMYPLAPKFAATLHEHTALDEYLTKEDL